MSTHTVRIGVLDIQGSVEEHFEMLKKISVVARLVKSLRDLDEVSGLIIPGGESTTVSKLLKSTGLDKAIRKRALYPQLTPLTLWGTCAGAILMAKKVTNGPSATSRPPQTLALMDMEIERNAYGSQTESFETNLAIEGFSKRPFRAIFIRAPKICSTAKYMEVLAHHGGLPVMLRQKNLLATMFHPELTGDPRIHEYFVKLVHQYADA